ncbi:MAG: YfhO family protein [Polyangia bacterium]
MRFPALAMKVEQDPRLQTRVAFAFIAAVVLAAFWKLTSMKGLIITDDIFASDLMNENFPYRFSLGNALHSGHWPLWVREIYGGFPLLARAEAGVCYPFNLALFGLFSPYVALNLTILLTLVIAGIGMYLYAREIGGSTLSGLVGAIAFCFSGYLISHLKHLSMANAACWLPLALTLLERAVRRNHHRPLLWFGIVFGLQHLAGNAQTAYYSGVLYLFYFPLRLFNRQGEVRAASKQSNTVRAAIDVFRNKLTWSFAGMLILGSLLAAVQLIPTYEMVSLSQRSGGVTFEYASKYAYDLKSVWTFFYPYSNGDIGNFTYTGKSIFWENSGYVGLLTLVLAVSAPVRWWKNWHARFFAASAVLSFLLVLGPGTPLYKVVFNTVPGMNYFRFPTRLLLVTDVSLVALACLGLTRLAQQLGARTLGSRQPVLVQSRRSLLLQAILLALIICDLLYFQLRQNPIVDMAQWIKPPRTVEILKQDPSLFRIFCLGGNRSHRKMFAQARGWEGDLQPFVEQREFLQPSSNVLYGLSSPNGYANLTPSYIVDIWGDQNSAGLITQTGSVQDENFRPTSLFWKLMRMYNVKYLTSFWPLSPAGKQRALGVYGGAYLYQYDDFLPRAYLVDGIVPVPDGRLALRMIASDAFDPEHSVLLDAEPPNYQPGESTGGTVEFVRYTTNQAEMRVHTARAAMLVFSDSYYPGWIAKVDGSATPIYRANVTQRAVVVPAGDHRVSFRFQPVTVVVGFWVSLGSLIVFLGGFLIPPLWRQRNCGKGAHRDPVLA